MKPLSIAFVTHLNWYKLQTAMVSDTCIHWLSSLASHIHKYVYCTNARNGIYICKKKHTGWNLRLKLKRNALHQLPIYGIRIGSHLRWTNDLHRLPHRTYHSRLQVKCKRFIDLIPSVSNILHKWAHFSLNSVMCFFDHIIYRIHMPWKFNGVYLLFQSLILA